MDQAILLCPLGALVADENYGTGDKSAHVEKSSKVQMQAARELR